MAKERVKDTLNQKSPFSLSLKPPADKMINRFKIRKRKEKNTAK
ncbi:hypothetical protein CLOLEP_00349 [[Clostridium] leptum DSM 753]|uniref:Uncharacterized protein n=1 Tax=[Clostridium] leptum DSM 753 TaxID=428125 RepID=A7VP73_9FIRM|nr:hypothetical protein CLOLEP_00349 [[Clostridium] leptum DSM 753]